MAQGLGACVRRLLGGIAWSLGSQREALTVADPLYTHHVLSCEWAEFTIHVGGGMEVKVKFEGEYVAAPLNRSELLELRDWLNKNIAPASSQSDAGSEHANR